MALHRYDFDLPKPVAESIQRWADAILFANWDIYRTAEDVGYNKEVHRGLVAVGVFFIRKHVQAIQRRTWGLWPARL